MDSRGMIKTVVKWFSTWNIILTRAKTLARVVQIVVAQLTPIICVDAIF
jgi:hypothetical protein